MENFTYLPVVAAITTNISCHTNVFIYTSLCINDVSR